MSSPRKPKEKEPSGQFVRHVNRKGKIYYLCAATNKKGQIRYVMKRTSEGALTRLPDGYVISENVNSQVSVGSIQPRLITEFEESQVLAGIKKYDLCDYRIEVKDAYITVFEPRLVDEPDLLRFGYAPVIQEFIKKKMEDIRTKQPFDPVMRFRLVDRESRLFEIERMTYRGRGGWMSLYKQGTLRDLIDAYLEHLGKDSFYDLI